MAVDHRSGIDQDQVAALVAAAEALLAGKGTVPKDFVGALFGRGAPEDLLRHPPEDIAALAAGAWATLAERKPGAPKIRLQTPADARLRGISVLEVVNDDMPFLVDSVMGELTERGVGIRLVVHPVFGVERDEHGRLISFDAARARGGQALRESLIHIHLDEIEDAAQRDEVVAGLAAVLADVRVCVLDWRPMMDRVEEVIIGLKTDPPPLPAAEVAESIAFLEWLIANNFTFLGVRQYAFAPDESALEPRLETGLGLLRAHEMRALQSGGRLTITPEIRAFLKEPQLLIITKSARRARVHRRTTMDYIGVKLFDRSGTLTGEVVVIGLFTSTAYTQTPGSIPYLRRKTAAIVARAGFGPEGHSGKALVNVLETYPRDELFQIDADTLYHFALLILQLDERPRVRVLLRRDRFDRFVSVLVYAPRDRYDSNVRRRIGDYLAQAFSGQVNAFHPFFPEGPLVRVHFIIDRNDGPPTEPERAGLEEAVAGIVRTWADTLTEALARAHEPERARALIARYRDAFSSGYREAYSPLVALHDIRLIEGLSPGRPLTADFHRRLADEGHCIGLKLWSYGRPIPLSERVPVLENMGFRVVDEQTYQIAVGTAVEPDVWFHDMMLERGHDADVGFDAVRHQLEATFITVIGGGAESDGYNALVLVAGLIWRDVVLIRALSRFLRQLRVPYSQGYMWATLTRHAHLAAQIVQLFHVRLDPRLDGSLQQRGEHEAEVVAAIDSALASVDSLDEDRILRLFVSAVRAAVRTNFYQVGADGRPKALIAIKFSSRTLEAVPLPRPLYEIFIYSPRLEAVHMRFGKVARGGIRWSDRPQDFRTEILGLVKAQQVKNAVIVPVGAKGGFVPKLIPKGATREAVQAEGIATYKLFMATLLDLTDNLVPLPDPPPHSPSKTGVDVPSPGEGRVGVVPPENVVRHDDDDPYLVVAADKGTATFSDIANAISAEHDFWLGDAFASGGSVGYDHKKMGITARGAWESVKRHFREMDVDIGKTPFTAVGVGDMSGDVFGNGLLRERTTKLVAAFDHRDIFIDPDPDPQKSFAERKRLFELPRSSWQDYDKALISKGGGVFPRAHKELALSKEAQAALGFEKAKAAPHEVMNAILKAPVDLLFFGGIGTYVRASTETDDAVGDRANDAIRSTGVELRCKVIGEGANLGMTQRGRIEAALRGIRLNTDAIDNSAGVNTSDVEVNLKIALSRPLRDGRLSAEARAALLAGMTEDVAALVLRNNYQQPLALSLAEQRGLEDMGFQRRLMQTLEAAGALDRAVEFLPDDKEIEERRRRMQPLTRPELSVLLAYAKLALNADLLDSKVPDDPYLGRELARYFPQAIVETFPDAVDHHRLRREIIVTQLANSMINRGGPTLVVRIADQTGASAASIAAAFAAVRDSYAMTALNGAIDALDNKISGKLQLALYGEVQELLLDRLVWFLRNVDLAQGLGAIIEHYRASIVALEQVLDDVLTPQAQAARKARVAELTGAGVPQETAHALANLPALTAAPDIAMVADRARQGIAEVAATYFAADAYFRIDRIANAARAIKVADYFDRLALDRALDQIGDAERRLAAAMAGNGVSGAKAVEEWLAPRRHEVERIRASVHEIANSGLTLSKLSVAASLLGDLVKQ